MSYGSRGSNLIFFFGILSVMQIIRISSLIFSIFQQRLYCKGIDIVSSVTKPQTKYNKIRYKQNIMFVNKLPSDKETLQRLSEIEAELGYQGNQYLFLRSIWKSHSHQYTHAVIDFDDQLDRLNKIVAMMKKHINFNVKKELSYQNHAYSGEFTVRETKALEAMNKAFFQAEQYRTRLATTQQQNSQLRKINDQLKEQIHELRKKRKQDIKSIKQLSQKTASLQNKILCSGHQQSFLRSSQVWQKSNSGKQDQRQQQSVLNISINGDNIHIPKINRQKSDRVMLQSKSKGRYSSRQQNDKWLNETSIIQPSNLDQSTMSMSSYGFCDPKMNRICSYNQQDKENNEQGQISKFVFKYQSERNLCKQRSVKKHKINPVINQQLLQSPKLGLKFIRQNNKNTLLRKSQKLLRSQVVPQE